MTCYLVAVVAGDRERWLLPTISRAREVVDAEAESMRRQGVQSRTVTVEVKEATATDKRDRNDGIPSKPKTTGLIGTEAV